MHNLNHNNNYWQFIYGTPTLCSLIVAFVFQQHMNSQHQITRSGTLMEMPYLPTLYQKINSVIVMNLFVLIPLSSEQQSKQNILYFFHTYINSVTVSCTFFLHSVSFHPTTCTHCFSSCHHLENHLPRKKAQVMAFRPSKKKKSCFSSRFI